MAHSDDSLNDSLSDRKKMILRAIVDAYISDGEPVGSKSLTHDAGIAYSSATIRNEMSELEAMGYLEQPHTSSGRVPSEQGFRFYVDSLMESYRMTTAELNELNRLANARIAKIDRILSDAGKLMSALTNYTSLTARPAPRTKSVLHFRTMPLSDDTMLLVMVVESNGIHNAKTSYIHSPGITQENAIIIEEALNFALSKRTVDEMTLPIVMEFRDKLDTLGLPGLSSKIINAVYDTLNENEEGDLRFEGVNLLLKYPEYSSPEKLGGVLESLEHKNELLSIIQKSDDSENDVQVYIGSENGLDNMKDSSLIFKKIRLGDNRVVGAIGVVGPVRMKYNRVIAVLEEFSKQITDAFENDGDI